MSHKLSIKIKILDREYPLQVDFEEEENFREAGRKINEAIKEFKEKYKIDDKQDLLSMFAIDTIIQKSIMDKKYQEFEKLIDTKLTHFEEIVGQNL